MTSSSIPPPPPGDPESWEEMAARVASEVTDITNLTYATTLAKAFASYLQVGFSHDQAFQLTLSEHQARLEMMTSRIIMNGGEEPDA